MYSGKIAVPPGGGGIRVYTMKLAQFFPLFHVKIHDLKYFILYCPVDVRLHYPFESGRLVITVSATVLFIQIKSDIEKYKSRKIFT
jgi:hypothetical protein